ncbi:hypothetical protein EIP91_000940 [Steccherinum ochraceum]|uniref:Peptidase metallopeptidase domain-containing protein n=1 Tax=Steccherinum ochraceum TaxID=92696 RepID=A0A4R0RVL8_9APHY|nr:hypothetical protein EIP91_000940 [Steccherinum ochraceum]
MSTPVSTPAVPDTTVNVTAATVTQVPPVAVTPALSAVDPSVGLSASAPAVIAAPSTDPVPASATNPPTVPTVTQVVAPPPINQSAIASQSLVAPNTISQSQPSLNPPVDQLAATSVNPTLSSNSFTPMASTTTSALPITLPPTVINPVPDSTPSPAATAPPPGVSAPPSQVNADTNSTQTVQPGVVPVFGAVNAAAPALPLSFAPAIAPTPPVAIQPTVAPSGSAAATGPAASTDTLISSTPSTGQTTATPAVATPTVPSTTNFIASRPVLGLGPAPIRSSVVNYQHTCADLAPPEVQIGAADRRNPNAVAYAVFAKSSLLWDIGATVTYAFVQGPNATSNFSGTANQQNKVNTVIAEWGRYANINFSLVASSTIPIPNLRITFDPSRGSWSSVGTLAQVVDSSLATMNLSSIQDTVDLQPNEQGVILHMFGHVLGLTHEHPKNLPLDPTAVSTFYTSSLGWTASQVQTNILNVYARHNLTNYLIPEFTSVMRYFMDGDMNLEDLDVLPTCDLSDKDKAFMVVNYPLAQLDPCAPEWTLDHALDVLGVPEYEKHAMLLARPEDVRKQYAMWFAEELLMASGRIPEGLSRPSPPITVASVGTGGIALRRQEDELEDKAWFRRACTDLSQSPEDLEDEHTSSRVAFAVIVRSNLLWDNGQTITYSYLGGNATQQRKVDSVAQEWSNYANLTFRKVASGGQIRISFDATDGSWSWVGRETLEVSPKKATMNFGWVRGTTSVLDNEEKGTILHEFGHALGLLHEHQSPARGGTLTLNEARVYEYYQITQGWTRERVKEQIIDVYDKDNISNYSELDLTSIMMYFMPKEMNKQNIEVKANVVLSDLDKAYIAINYPFQKKDPRWTLAHALEVAGVTGAAKTEIAKEKDASVIRQKFSVWNAARRAEVNMSQSKIVRDLDRSLDDETILEEVALQETNLEDEESQETMFEQTIDQKEAHASGWCGAQEPDVLAGEAFEEVVERDARALGPGRGVSVRAQYLWNAGYTITYFFQQAEYQNVNPRDDERLYRLHWLRHCMGNWTDACGIRFMHVATEAQADLKIWWHEPVLFPHGLHVSWAAFGTFARNWVNTPLTHGGQANTNLFLRMRYPGILFPNHPQLDWILRDMRHELGHILGLRHEHVSPLSQSQAVFEQVPDTQRIGIWTNWDPQSIMIYNDQPLRGNPGIATGYFFDLSQRDKDFVKALYAPDDTVFRQAASALGLSDGAIDQIFDDANVPLGFPNLNQWNVVLPEIRYQLAVQLQRRWGPGLPGSMVPSRGAQAPSADRERVPRQTVAPRDLNPARGVEDPTTEDGRVRTSGNFLTVLVDSLKKFFNPGGNQMFALQFPGRFLQISQYAWDTGSAGIYGQFIKPVVVNESEFRLTDQLYDVSEVIAGPNGASMSQAYETVLNNLIPVFRSNGLAQQQDLIRRWLLRDVQTTPWIREIIERQHTAGRDDSMDDSENDGLQATATGAPSFAISNKLSDGTLTRMELSNALMLEYLLAKQAWEVERDTMIEEALQLQLGTAESGAALNALTRRLAHTTATREAQLAAKYADAVVRGYTHNVREYLGYLDIRSPAEALQDAKDALREAAMSSLDGSLNVYPVQMTPIDWFEGLSTSFTMEDLTQDPELIVQQIRAKSTQVDVLNSQLTALRFGSQGDPDELRETVVSAQERLDDAQADLALKYSTNVISMVKTCYTSNGELDVAQVAGLEGAGDLVGVVLDNLVSDMQATSAAQKTLTNASRAYSQALAGFALAQATDTRQQQEQIQRHIASLTGEIEELTSRFTSLNRLNDRPAPSEAQPLLIDVPSFPAANEGSGSSTAGGSRWQDIEIHHEVKSDYTKEATSASSSASSAHVNLWFGSGSTSQSSSQASSTSAAASYTNNVTIGFRATLVTVDRAGWFQPQFFKESGSFYHVDPSISWSKWPEGVNNVDDLKNLSQKNLGGLNSRSLLPAFPVGYIICKDITIKISETRSEGNASKRNLRQDASASGGILVFSYAQSTSSTSSENSYSFQSCADGCVIRIPGPQILGYILQLTDNDTTSDLPRRLPDDFFIPDSEYDAVTAGIGLDNGPAAGLRHIPLLTEEPVTPFFREIDGILKKAGVPSSTMEGIREAVKKELDVISDEVADRVRRG